MTMKIEKQDIFVRDVVKDFIDDPNLGCTGYGGRLNIRPAFQREFVYDNNQCAAVIKSVLQGFPLNIMYWIRSGDGKFEMLDGQQRTISICQYVHGGFMLEYKSFNSLTPEEQEKILNYKLMVYLCEGTDKDKLDWFKVINTAGEKLTNQEALNAIYACRWLTDAKNYFSRPNCPAYSKYNKYVKGSAIRQEILETALEWIVDRDGLKKIEHYMDKQKSNNTATAIDLWNYFQSVMTWAKSTFPKYRSEMKSVEWGKLYNAHHNDNLDPAQLEQEIERLMTDDDVTSKRGIYSYVLDGKEQHLNIRGFSKSMIRSAYERQKGICKKCGNHFELEEMQADHITPWSLGGKTTADNCQMLCADCNRRKSNH